MRVGELSQPAMREDLVLRQVDEDFFVYDPISDQVMLLNISAALVFDLCDGTRTPDEIAAEVAVAFEADGTRVDDGVLETLDRLAASGLMRNVSNPE